MDDVTDTVFRQVIASCAPPDLFFTEFVNVDALQSKGREATLKRLKFTDKERPIVAQIWGKEPDNFYKTAKELAGMGFDGVDINFGCPDKNVVRNGTCSAFILPQNRAGALEIIQAVRAGAPALPLSVKTRLGFNEVDLSWHKLLLQQKLNMLTIHGRTKSQMSKVPADWGQIAKIRELRDKISPTSAAPYVKTSEVKKASAGRPTTLIIGNGDVINRAQGSKLAAQYSLDGIMIGRGIFDDPFAFAAPLCKAQPCIKAEPCNNWGHWSKEAKVALYRRHVELFAKTWKNNERKVHTLNKFCKIYIQGFDGAKELREQLMAAKSTDELLNLLTS
jgi:tRNA-dihydrouridine synthase